MRNAKKTLSLMMIAIFTTFIVLSGIPAGAAVTKAQATATVKAATAAVVKAEASVKATGFNTNTAKKLTATAATATAGVKKLGTAYNPTYLKLVARYQAVNKKIAAVIAALNKVYTDAEKAVTAAEKATDGDLVDLVGDEAALANAQGAVTAALEFIVALDQNSANYKGLMARIDAANNLIVKAMDEIAANQAAADKEAADKAAAEAAAKAEAAAIAAADTAVKAVEASTTAAIALDLGKVAVTAVAAVKTPEKVAEFSARLKVVADKFTPATIASVSAVDGTITVTFNKKPLTTPAAADFTVTKKVTTDVAVTTTVAATVTVVSDTAVTLAVPAVAATTTAQAVLYSVAYGTATAVPAAAAYDVAALPALAATASANNLKEITVVFNQEVTKATAEEETYYAGVTASTAVLQADMKTVVLTLANGSELVNQTAYTLTINNVVAAKTALKPTVKVTFTALDLNLPSVESVAITGPQSVKLTFSEPISTVGTATLDDGVNYITVPSAPVNARTLTLTTGVTLAAGAHKLVLAGFTDYQGYKTVSQTFNFNVVADTSAPTIALTSVTQTEAVFTFSKPVTVGSAFTVYHTLNNSSNYVGTASLDADGVTLTVDFSAHPMPAGSVNFFFNNSTTSSTATKDLWGNLFAATTTLTGTVVADTAAPTYTVTVVNNTTLDVVFSETVAAGAGTNGSELTTNYTVKDLSGTASNVTGAVLQSDNKTVRLTVAQLNGGSYVLTVANVADRNIVPNKMGSVATTVAVTDTVNPLISSVYFAGSTSASAAGKIVVKFNEAMNAAKLADKTNYVYTTNNWTTTNTLGSNDTVTVATDNKSVTISIAAVQFGVANNKVKFGPLTDVAGNSLSDGGSPATLYPVGGYVYAATLDAVTIVSAKAISTTQIQITLSQPVTSAVAGDFKFVKIDGSTLGLTANVASVTTNSSNQGVITFTMSGSLTTAAQFGSTPADIYVETIATPTSETSVLGTKLSAMTTSGTVLVADRVAPALTTAVVTNTSTITLTFTEALEDTTFAATLNGFSVSAGTLTSVTHASGTNVVVLHSTEADFVVGSTVSYNTVAGITDAATTANALATFTATTVAP